MAIQVDRLTGFTVPLRLRPQHGDFDRLNGTQYLPAENAHDQEYRNQPQIAELNALNAAVAVIRFKQHMGFFDRLTDSPAVVFDVAGMMVDAAA